MKGITQIQTISAIRFDFWDRITSILQQDPNVFVIGEVRDLETAEIACRAALVGRLVFAALHTSSAQQAVTRLRNLGVPEYLLEATLKAVVAQTLENVSCQLCYGEGRPSCLRTGSS